MSETNDPTGGVKFRGDDGLDNAKHSLLSLEAKLATDQDLQLKMLACMQEYIYRKGVHALVVPSVAIEVTRFMCERIGEKRV